MLELLVAARQGDTDAVETLLQEGANPDERNDQGRTALHEAVAGGHAQTVACLLVYGANHRLADNQERTPLGLPHTPIKLLHAIRQHHRRFRPRRNAAGTKLSGAVAGWVHDLDEKGIVKVSGLLSAEEVTGLRHDFADFIRNLEAKLARGTGVFQNYDEEEHLWPADQAFVTNNVFKYSAELIRLFCRDSLVQVANTYLGRPAFITRGLAMRYLATPPRSNDMFGWHHDMEDKRLKVMILLTNVGPDDQHMSYVLGSHRLFHPYKMFFKNACSLEYCGEHLPRVEVYDCLGMAGDVFFFDSNGTHRGHRRETAKVRDVFLVEYSTARNDVWGGDISPQVVDDIPLAGANPFAWMMTAEKKWHRPFTRKAPEWIESLPAVEAWR
jgi:hypothetical protein